MSLVRKESRPSITYPGEKNEGLKKFLFTGLEGTREDGPLRGRSR